MRRPPWSACLVLTAALAGCGDDAPAVPRPVDEAHLLQAQAAAQAAYDQAPNGIVRDQVLSRWRERDVCAAIHKADFSGWVGTVSEIQPGGAFTLDLGQSVSLDAQADAGTGLFQAITRLQEGAEVRFSGAFVSDDAACPGQIVALPLGDIALTAPHFAVVVTTITPIPPR